MAGKKKATKRQTTEKVKKTVEHKSTTTDDVPEGTPPLVLEVEAVDPSLPVNLPSVITIEEVVEHSMEGTAPQPEAVKPFAPGLPETNGTTREMLSPVLTYREGINITVRLGEKWLGYRGPIHIRAREGASVAMYGHVLDTIWVPQFTDLVDNPPILQFNHDPFCRAYSSLLQTMTKCYPKIRGGFGEGDIPGFTKESGVTLVFYEISMAHEELAELS